MAKLTKRWWTQLASSAAILRDDEIKGFGLRVSPGSSKSVLFLSAAPATRRLLGAQPRCAVLPGST